MSFMVSQYVLVRFSIIIFSSKYLSARIWPAIWKVWRFDISYLIPKFLVNNYFDCKQYTNMTWFIELQITGSQRQRSHIVIQQTILYLIQQIFEQCLQLNVLQGGDNKMIIKYITCSVKTNYFLPSRYRRWTEVRLHCVILIAVSYGTYIGKETYTKL